MLQNIYLVWILLFHSKKSIFVLITMTTVLKWATKLVSTWYDQINEIALFTSCINLLLKFCLDIIEIFPNKSQNDLTNYYLTFVFEALKFCYELKKWLKSFLFYFSRWSQYLHYYRNISHTTNDWDFDKAVIDNNFV